MIAAQLICLTRRRLLMGAAVLLPVLVVLIVLGIRILLHAHAPGDHPPAGGGDGYDATLQGVTGVVGLLAVVLGATAGSSDSSSGVIRDLISTGRSRVVLVLERLPAPVVVTIAITLLGALAAVLAGALVSGETALPSLGAIGRDVAGTAVVSAAMAVVACGFASLVGSRGIAVGSILGWVLVGETALTFALKALSDGSQGILLGPAQGAIQEAIAGDVPSEPAISLALAIPALAAWVALCVGLGAARTARKEW